MAPVFLGKDDIGLRKAPVNPQGRVVPRDGAFGLRGVGFVALVLENGLGAKDGKTVRKALGNK